MSLESIIEKSKVDKLELITTSIQLPKHLKEQMQSICKSNEITVNSFMVNLIDDVLNGDLKDKTSLEVVERLSSLIKQKEELNVHYNNNGNDNIIEFNDGSTIDIKEKIVEIDLMIRILKRGF